MIYLHEIINDPKIDDIYFATEYFSKESIGDIIYKINVQNIYHNKDYKKKDKINEMMTKKL